MGKKDKKIERQTEGLGLVVRLFGGAVVVAVLGAGIGSYRWWRASQDEAAQIERLKLLGTKVELQTKLQKMMKEMEDTEAQRQEAEKDKDPSMGQGVVASQAKLITRLLELVQQVEALNGEDQREERLKVSEQVEKELAELEATSQQNAGTAVGKQQAGLVALVRSALKSDRDGDEVGDEWNEEALRQKHGLITYATPSYWDEAYAGGQYGEAFEWYGAWKEKDLNKVSLGDVVGPLLPQGARILELGGGNSGLSVAMHKEGHKPIVSIDISQAVVDQMKKRHGESDDTLTYKAMDASAMDFQDGAFDVAVEKGMFDSLYAGSGERVQSTLAEIVRVLKPGGRLISVSFSKDRISRLFTPAAEEELAALAPLSCKVAAEMSYHKGASSDNESDSGEKMIYVYSCDRGFSL